jgi:hypothetical protein
MGEHEEGPSSLESPNIQACLGEFEHHRDAHGAAEAVRCLKRNKEFIVWDDELGRMKCLAEVNDPGWAGIMEEMTKAFGITSREEWIAVKDKYNLTMY